MTDAAKRALVVVDVDPRSSDRAVEALRMSLGVAAATNDVTVVLRGEAVALTGPERNALPGGARAAGFLDGLERLGVRVETGEDVDLTAADAVIRWTAAEGTRRIVFDSPSGDDLPLTDDPTTPAVEALLDRILDHDRVVVW